MSATSRTRRLRWGILGVANIALRAVMPAIQASQNGLIHAVASRDLTKAQQAATQFHAACTYGTYTELLEDPDVDAVYIPLPNHLHGPWTVQAAAAGKHILCEKPLALNAREAEGMVEECDRNGVRLMEAFMYRFHPRTREIRRLIEVGRIGEPSLVRASFSFQMSRFPNVRLDPTMGGGATMDVGCYGINFARYVFDDEPIEVTAFADWGRSTRVDETLVGTLRFASGALAQIDCSFNVPRRMLAEVAGAKGRIEMPSAWLPGASDAPLVIEAADGAVETELMPGVDQYRVMVEEFAAAVMQSLPVPLPPADAIANMRVIDALLESARTGHAVNLAG